MNGLRPAGEISPAKTLLGTPFIVIGQDFDVGSHIKFAFLSMISKKPLNFYP